MLNLSPATRVYVATAPVDLRGSFNALSAHVENVLAGDPFSGHLFLFTNRRRNRLKILCWDGTGLWVCAKRLERGRFSWPTLETDATQLRQGELAALLNGLEVRVKEGWYRR